MMWMLRKETKLYLWDWAEIDSAAPSPSRGPLFLIAKASDS